MPLAPPSDPFRRMSTEPSEHAADTIAVREDERFDASRVADYLKGRLPGATGPLRVRQFGGGAANLTYLLRFPESEAEYVLRRPPLGPVPKGAHDMAREHAVLSRLHAAYPLAPEAHLYCGDPEVIGAEFFVMERRRGVVVRTRMPEGFAEVEDAPQRMAGALVDALAALHAVDYEAVGLGDLGRPEGFISRQIEGWHRRWHNAQTDDLDPAALDTMHAVYTWLKQHEPAEQDATLVHNDYKLDNVMLAEEDPGQAVAVFDWDMCTLGDPLSDLGALLTYWTQPADPAPFRQMAMMPVDRRFPSRHWLAARYAEKSGRGVADLRFYHALGLFRLAVILAQIYIRFKRGQTQDRRFAGFGPMIGVVARSALRVAEKS